MNIMIQDFPMLLEYKKLEFNKNLNVSKIENLLSVYHDSDSFGAENQKLESILNHKDLKPFGLNEKTWKTANFDGKICIEEIVQIIN